MLEEFIREYGYWTVLVGAMIEGESVILTASALAAMGYLSLFWVGIITFLGTFVADQAIYFLGHFYGAKTLGYLGRRFEFLKAPIDKGLSFLKRHETLYILSFRFIYGIRIISPFIIGSQNIRFRRFAFLNFIAAILWTVVSCALGYFLGTLLNKITHHIGLVILGIILSVLVISWLIRKKS